MSNESLRGKASGFLFLESALMANDTKRGNPTRPYTPCLSK
jgi:hypothetical protein